MDNKTHCLIFGYVNELTEKDSLAPVEIANICILYYYQMERFYKSGDPIKIISSDDTIAGNNIAKIIKQAGWISVYGDIVIDATKYPNTIYEWTF